MKRLFNPLLAKGADTNSQNELGCTAFHWAANRYDKTLYLLSDYDPNGPNQRDFYGRTALHLASTQGNLRVVRALIAMRSTDCDIRDNFGRTALCDAKRRGHHDIIKALQNPAERLTDEISAVQIICPQAWTGVVCDVCMGFILSDETWYHCSLCRDGDHDTCDWCYQVRGNAVRIASMSGNSAANYQPTDCESKNQGCKHIHTDYEQSI